MVFNLETFINSFITSPGIHSIITNPVWTSILITTIIMIIIYFQFADADEDSLSDWPLWIQTSIWILISALTVTYLHFKNVDVERTRKEGESLESKVVDKTTNGTMTGVPVAGGNQDLFSGAFRSAPQRPAPLPIDPVENMAPTAVLGSNYDTQGVQVPRVQAEKHEPVNVTVNISGTGLGPTESNKNGKK
jgi:hypothetical protein